MKQYIKGRASSQVGGQDVCVESSPSHPPAMWLGPAPLLPRVIFVLSKRRIIFSFQGFLRLFSVPFSGIPKESSTCCNTFWSRSQKCEPRVVLNLNFKKLMRMSSHVKKKPTANPLWVMKVHLKVSTGRCRPLAYESSPVCEGSHG